MTADRNFIERVHGLALSAHEHNSARVNAMTELRAAVRQIDKVMDDATPHVVAGCQAVGSILYLCQDKLGTAIPLSNEAKSLPHPAGTVGNPAPGRVLSVLFLAGVASLAVAAGSPRSEGRPVSIPESRTDGSNFLTQARLAVVRHQWEDGLRLYQLAKFNQADPADSLAGMAECSLRLKRYPDALMYCTLLEQATDGRSYLALRLRGCVAEETGDGKIAKEWYQAAEQAGDPDAGVLHRRIK